jgi:hypothetical protein
MRLDLISLAKIYILFFGLVHFSHIISMLGINEIIISAPPYLTFWWWHLLLLVVYGVVPIIAVLTDNEKSCLVVAGISLIGMFMGAFQVLTMTMSLHFIFAFLNSLAAVFSLLLAVEIVALKVSAEILSLGWSQF